MPHKKMSHKKNKQKVFFFFFSGDFNGKAFNNTELIRNNAFSYI